MQGGDITLNGTKTVESRSIYGPSSGFEDENFKVAHRSAGIVSMANTGKNTNNDQFLVTTAATPWLDRQHVAFGMVVEGMDVVHRVEAVAVDAKGAPFEECVVVDSGELPVDGRYHIEL